MSIEFSSFNWVKLLLDDSTLSPNAKYIGLYLSTYMNQHQEMAWPSLARIQGHTGLSKNTVIKYLKELESIGWLITERQAKSVQTLGGLQACNRYYINLPDKVVREMNSLEKGGSNEGERWFKSEAKGVREVNTNNNIITNNNNKQFYKKTGKSKSAFEKSKAEFPPKFEPSRDCRTGESLEACKIRAWRQYERQ